jgi:hypothetical protein
MLGGYAIQYNLNQRHHQGASCNNMLKQKSMRTKVENTIPTVSEKNTVYSNLQQVYSNLQQEIVTCCVFIEC